MRSNLSSSDQRRKVQYARCLERLHHRLLVHPHAPLPELRLPQLPLRRRRIGPDVLAQHFNPDYPKNRS